MRVCYTFTEPIWMVFSLEIDWTLMKYISNFLLRYEETDRDTSEFIILTWTSTDSINDGENKRNGLLNTVREHWHSWICVIQFCWQNQEEPSFFPMDTGNFSHLTTAMRETLIPVFWDCDITPVESIEPFLRPSIGLESSV